MPGTVLLLAAAPVGKGCLVDAASVLPVLAAVPPAVLSGTDTANVVELADPLEPQAVLTRLRAAAAAPGPLTVFVTGQLLLDRRQHLPHLALARTTTATVRYTGLPWQWIREELRLRQAGTTTLVLDLHADAETWEWLRSHPLDCGRNIAVYGRVAPPPSRRTVGAPTYMKAVATILRSGHRPAVPELHQQVLARLGDEVYRDVVLGVPGVGVPGVGVPGVGVAVPAGGFAPRPPYRPERPRPQTPPPSASLERGDPHDGLSDADRSREGAVGRSGGSDADRSGGSDADRSGASDTGRSGASDTGRSRGSDTGRSVAAAAARSVAGAAARQADSEAARPAHDDPHAYITAAVQSGRHTDADALAAEHEQAAVRAHGAGSEQALHWAEVRADLAMFAGDPVRSCRTWLAVATARLGAGQTPDTPAVEAAVDRAHHQWGQIRDADSARELGFALAQLRGRVPGRREGALENIKQQLSQLQTQN
ncbi:hypothetical protein CLM62_22165 [Streptomyces sp. SA15]|uniref:hypothetical protein n=1 Tax=Streptomyces sp. SA15 TaxID=934019 RepID=UPI000BAEBF3E|nr:hypothetical protein [Streptomyces sp. SA15]PAZ14130.1 hypothetical protein CLM62_22165 [Streptomyces sp. SA15]